MPILWETLAFTAKGLVVFAIFAGCILLLFRARKGQDDGAEGRLRVKRLNDSLKRRALSLSHAIMSPKAFKQHYKALKKTLDKPQPSERNLFVLDFKGDMMASQVEGLREEISALLMVATPQDEVVLRLESPGGAAHSYGLAASQLARLRSKKIPLTICVDRVAASGGYMMACVADQIIAAPFAIIGSIGVVAPMPNVHRLLSRMGVDFENFTAGKYKRTVSVLAENDEEGRRKFQEQLEEVHTQFKRFVQDNRSELDIEEVATGEHWLGVRAAELGLVNALLTSDDYLMGQAEQANIFEVSFERPKSLQERFSGGLTSVLERLSLGIRGY